MNKLKRLFLKCNKQNLGVNVALIILGGLFIIFPENSLKIICYVLGAFLCIGGAYKLIEYFKDGIKDITSYGLAGGIALVVIGALLFIKPDFISGVATALFGVVLLISAIIKIQQALNVKAGHGRAWWTILLVALVLLAGGLISLFFPFATKRALFFAVGVSLAVSGALSTITDFYYTARVYDCASAEKDALPE